MERSQATNTMTNGAKTSKNWKPYTGPTMLTAGSAGIMERSTHTDAMHVGAKATETVRLPTLVLTIHRAAAR